MPLTSEQLKGRIKNIAKDNKADARVLLRIYMMERFLERVAASIHAENFIIKGGILVTSMIGVSMRSTMDIDASIRNFTLSEEEALLIIRDICNIDVDDGVSFEIKDVAQIMDEMEYPGLRISMNAFLENMVIPIKIDISTGDAITPDAIEYDYKLLLEDRTIKLWSYNLETTLAEKMQTILSRGTLNTRMRDFYDVYALTLYLADRIDDSILKDAFNATCAKRSTQKLASEGQQILEGIANDSTLNALWINYQRKYDYASIISFNEIMTMVNQLFSRII